MVRNFILGWRSSGAVKCNLLPYNWRFTSPYNFQVIPILIHFFTLTPLKVYYFAPTTSASSNVKPDASQSKAMFHNDIRFATVYHRIYCQKFFRLSNQTSRYICMCIRINYVPPFISATVSILHHTCTTINNLIKDHRPNITQCEMWRSWEGTYSPI